VAAGGVLGFPVFSALALAHVPASRGAVIVGLLPAATAGYATVRGGERPSPAFWAAALAGLGAVLVFAATTGAGLAPEPADLLLLAAVASAAAAYGEGAGLAHRLGGWQVIAWALVVSLPVTVPVTAAAVVLHGPVGEVTGGAAAGFAYVAVVSAFLGFLPWYAGLARGGVAHVSQVQLAQPLLSLVWAWALLGEHITVPTVVAAVAVLACVLAGRRATVARAAPPGDRPEPGVRVDEGGRPEPGVAVGVS
jgi:drug/metabolite transporter (DMT)-like permease